LTLLGIPLLPLLSQHPKRGNTIVFTNIASRQEVPLQSPAGDWSRTICLLPVGGDRLPSLVAVA
jgi:hypothetical protein